MEIVRVESEKASYYGGAQAWFEKKQQQKYGCGIIACANLIYGIDKKEKIKKEDYMTLANLLARKYLHVLPGLGINGFGLWFGLNRYFRREKLGYRCHWGTAPWKLWDRVEDMLEQGLPVVLSIGPNFPIPFGKKKLALYQKNASGYYQVQFVNAHYVSVTRIEGDWVKLSSWGNTYYIRKSEYKKYVLRHSNYLYSNILVIHAQHKD